jgi:hypothetical protein
MNSTPGISSNPDEISVLNDSSENHKVWTGRQPNDSPDGLYDYGSTMKSFKSVAAGLTSRSRPRQMIMPTSPPPPPILEEAAAKGKERQKEKKEKPAKAQQHGSKANGSWMHDHVNRFMTLTPQMPRHQRVPPFQYPQPAVMMVPMAGKKSGTFSSRQKNAPLPIPPYMMYRGPPPFGAPYGSQHGFYDPPPPLVPHPGSRQADERHFLPRLLSPEDEAYYRQQQYATIDKSNRFRKSKGSKSPMASDSNAEDSEFSEYKKKPSAQKPSRSYGSLANLQIAPNGDPVASAHLHSNGHTLPAEIKRPRDVLQLLGDLDLTDETIERSEVPPGLYPPQRQPQNFAFGGAMASQRMAAMPPEPPSHYPHPPRQRVKP